MIASDILIQFKERMHLEGDEDANLGRILSASEKELKRICGDYNIETDEDFKELVFERARYAYNDALEYFSKNFRTEINSLGMVKALDEMAGDPVATVQVQTESQFGRLTLPCGCVGECTHRE